MSGRRAWRARSRADQFSGLGRLLLSFRFPPVFLLRLEGVSTLHTCYLEREYRSFATAKCNAKRCFGTNQPLCSPPPQRARFRFSCSPAHDIDESLDIMRWALTQHDPEQRLPRSAASLLATFDGACKPHLDRCKYAVRYDVHAITHWAEGLAILCKLDNRLADQGYIGGAVQRFDGIVLFPNPRAPGRLPLANGRSAPHLWTIVGFFSHAGD